MERERDRGRQKESRQIDGQPVTIADLQKQGGLNIQL